VFDKGIQYSKTLFFDLHIEKVTMILLFVSNNPGELELREEKGLQRVLDFSMSIKNH
jgi:hypothetical protein